MTRPKKEDRSSIAESTLTIRLTKSDRLALSQLVALRSEELSSEGIEVTAASLVRGLIRQAAQAKGILGTLPTRQKHNHV